MKTIKRLICLLLTLIMVFAAGAEIFAFSIRSLKETEKPTYKIVSVGDSTAVGIGLNDCGIYGDNQFQFGKYYKSDQLFLYEKGLGEHASKYSYANQLVNYIQKTKPGYDVQYTNLAMSAMRANEMRALIDDEFNILADKYTKYKLDSYYSSFSNLYGSEHPEGFRSYYQNEVKNADLILVDCIMNCFTSYLADRLSNPNEYMYSDGIDVVLKQVSPELALKYTNARNSFIDTFGEESVNNDIVKVLDTLAYCALDMVINCDGLIKSIRNINPNATILVSGTYNPFRGMSINLFGIEISMEKLVDIIFDLTNDYLQYFAPSRSEYTYYETPQNVETIREYMDRYNDAREIPNQTLFVLIDDIARYYPNSQFGKIFPEGTISTTIVINAIKDVQQHGLKADSKNIEIANRMYKYLNILLKGIQLKEIDGLAAIDLILENGSRDVSDALETPICKLSSKTKTIAFIIAEQDIRGGGAAHFSRLGCYQKYVAARTAYKLATCPILN